LEESRLNPTILETTPTKPLPIVAEEAPQLEAPLGPENDSEYTFTDSSVLEYTIIGGKKKKKKKKKKKMSRQESQGSALRTESAMQPIEEEKEEEP
jgi:hypothetical protein